MSSLVYRSAIILLSVYAIISVFPIVNLHWNEQVSCPTIGVIPACYLVLVGYIGVLLSVLLPPFFATFVKAHIIFIISWLVVSLFALMGIFGEVTHLWSCPKTATGIPKCFFSAGLALIIGLLFWRLKKIEKAKSST